MTYWTIQGMEAWEQAQAVGYLAGNKEYICHPSWSQPYEWLMGQMRQRLGMAQPHYPVWMWCTRPDLRQRCHVSKGEHAVLLRVELDAQHVLLSDFGAWHYVLNDWVLEAYEGEVIEKEKSWERIFDFDFLRAYPDWFSEPEPQATTGAIPLRNLKLVREFVGR
jgi:hypothetical protein